MKEFEITNKIEETRQAYHEAVQNDESPSVTRKLSEEIKDLTEKRSQLLSKGAEDCPECGSTVIGMKKRRGEYEVGCPICPTRARGESVEEAVYMWNEGEYVTETPQEVESEVQEEKEDKG